MYCCILFLFFFWFLCYVCLLVFVCLKSNDIFCLIGHCQLPCILFCNFCLFLFSFALFFALFGLVWFGLVWFHWFGSLYWPPIYFTNGIEGNSWIILLKVQYWHQHQYYTRANYEQEKNLGESKKISFLC